MTGALYPKKCVLAAMMAFCLMVALSTPCTASTGVILTVTGTVNMSVGGETLPAKTGATLKPGDAVKSVDGRVTVMLADGTMKPVAPGETFVIPAPGAAQSGDTLVARLVETVKETAGQGRGPTVKGMVRGLKELVPLYPHNSVVTADDLRFRWQPVENLEHVEIAVKSYSPKYRYSFPVEPGVNSTGMPGEAPPLDAGEKYYWKVEGVTVGTAEPHTSPLRWFSILEAEKQGQLDAEMEKIDRMEGLSAADRKLLKANVYILYALYHRAAGILGEMLENAPGDAGLKDLLTGVRLKMDLPEADKL